MFAQTAALTTTLSSSPIFCGLFFVILTSMALYARAVPQGGRCWWGLLILVAILIMTAFIFSEGLLRVVLIDAASFAAVAMVMVQGTPQAVTAAKRYLVLLAPAILFMMIGLYLVGQANMSTEPLLSKLTAALLITGFGIKLALVPFYFWLPGVAESAAPMTTVLIISVVDIAAFTELVELRQSAAWVFTNFAPVWLTVALLSIFGGAIMALAQHNLKRMLAFSTMDDLGYLLLGVLIGPGLGMTGALIGALCHALEKMILFGAVGVVEKQRGNPLTLDNSHGLLAGYPICGAAFITAALGMIGVPPLLGFAGRWRVYLAGTQYGGPWLLAGLSVASVITLLYYVRAIHRVWFGTPQTKEDIRQEPVLAAGVLAVLALAIIIAGLFPAWVTGLLTI